MEICECGNPEREHHPSLHYAEKRDALRVKVKAFMDETYPEWMFGETFNRGMVALVAACFILDQGGTQ